METDYHYDHPDIMRNKMHSHRVENEDQLMWSLTLHGYFYKNIFQDAVAIGGLLPQCTIHHSPSPLHSTVSLPFTRAVILGVGLANIASFESICQFTGQLVSEERTSHPRHSW